MTLGRKMALIRADKGMRQIDLALEMGYSPALVGNYENERCSVSKDVLATFRTVTNTEDVPLLEHELVDAKKKLHSWYDLIITGQMERAKELYDGFANAVKWSYDTDLKNIFEIFCAMYYYGLGDIDECNRIVEALEGREHDFASEQLLFYWYTLGYCAFYKWQYKSALEFFLKSEELGERAGLSSKQLYFNIGFCLTYMGYSNLAIEYLEKSQSSVLDARAVAYGPSTQRFLAMCHSRLGRVEKALKLLDDYHEYLIAENKSSNTALSVLHFNLAMVYDEAGDYEKAQENYDKTFEHHKAKDELYLEYMCNKATFLRNNDKIKETQECVNEGLSLASKDTLWYEWLNAIRHSLSLGNKSSQGYLQWTAIPKLMEHGKYYEVMKIYTWLSSHCEEENKYKPALKYGKQASAIYSKLVKGDVSL